MATATMPRVGDEIKLDANPQTFALKFATGKTVPSRFPGGRVMFTAIDDRKLFLNDADASDFEHGLIEQRIGPADFIRVSRVAHGRGGGFAIRVERVEDEPQRDTRNSRDYTPELTRSIEMARERTASASSERTLPAPAATTSTNYQERNNGNNTANLPSNSTPALSQTAARFMGAYKDAVDILIESQGYAKRQGLLLDIRCEDVRCLAATIMIDNQKGGR